MAPDRHLPFLTRRKTRLQAPHACVRAALDGLLPDRLADFLRGEHPTHCAKEVARRADVPERTVERWLAGLAVPSLPHFLKLLRAYGPPLLRAVLDEAGPDGQTTEPAPAGHQTRGRASGGPGGDDGLAWLERLELVTAEADAADKLAVVVEALERLKGR